MEGGGNWEVNAKGGLVGWGEEADEKSVPWRKKARGRLREEREERRKTKNSICAA